MKLATLLLAISPLAFTLWLAIVWPRRAVIMAVPVAIIVGACVWNRGRVE